MQRLDKPLGDSETPSNVVSRAVAVIEARLASGASVSALEKESVLVTPAATSVATSSQSLFGSGNKAPVDTNPEASAGVYGRAFYDNLPADLLPRSKSPEYYLEPGKVYNYNVPADIQCKVRN